MRTFEGIIFDIDGTLTSTNELIFESFRYVANKYFKKSPTDEEILSLFGPPEDVILKDWSGDQFDTVREDYYDFYIKNHHMAALYPGIKEILDLIKERNVTLSIYTGKGRTAAGITLNELGIKKYFDMVVTGEDVKEHKPSAEGILVFIKKFNLSPDKVLMIGDSVSDIKAARGAGVKIASVVWDSLSKDRVLEFGSDFVFYKVSELHHFINENI